MGDGRNVFALRSEDVAKGEPAGSRHVVATEIMEMPLIGTQWPMEPDRVIEADAVDVLALKAAADHGRLANCVGREIIRGVSEPIPVNEWVDRGGRELPIYPNPSGHTTVVRAIRGHQRL